MSAPPSVEPTITLTGAGGALGRILRPGLLAAGYQLRSLDLVTLDPFSPAEQTLTGDLRDPALIDRALEGQSAVLHFAGTSVERPLPEITANNLTALHALYEGARRHAVPRIVLASSNHAFGMHDAAEPLTAASPYRPDGLYGLSKMWGEGMARLYWDKFGIETVCLRIGSALDRPTERRHLVTWLGHHDLLHLVLRSLQARTVGFLPVWGISANTRARWTDDAAAILAYHPTQNAEDHARAIETAGPVHRHIGGSFAHSDPIADPMRPERPVHVDP